MCFHRMITPDQLHQNKNNSFRDQVYHQTIIQLIGFSNNFKK